MVVIFDALGMSDDARAQADWLAEHGFLAVTPDLYAGGNKPACMVATFRELGGARGQGVRRHRGHPAWLAARDDCTGRVGVIGFCMGGGFALVLASGHGFAASSVNYGMVPKDADALLADACPVVGSFGAIATARCEARPEARGRVGGERREPTTSRSTPMPATRSSTSTTACCSRSSGRRHGRRLSRGVGDRRRASGSLTFFDRHLAGDRRSVPVVSPRMAPSVPPSSLIDLLTLEELDTNLYRASNPADDGRARLYGGQVAAQALAAAAATVTTTGSRTRCTGTSCAAVDSTGPRSWRSIATATGGRSRLGT